MPLYMRKVSVVKKLHLIYALNVADWICTLILLESGRFFEANPIAARFMESLSAGFAIKCIFPLVIILMMARLTATLDSGGLRTADRFVSFGLVYYLAINLDHAVNIILLFFGKGT